MKRKYKVAKTEYTKAMLPQTRKAIFFDVVKLQWKHLLLLGLILLLFYLPLLLSTAVKDIYISAVYAGLEGADDNAKYTAMQSVVYLDMLRSLINILFIAVFAVGFSGVLRIIRQHAWSENVHTPTDFAKGLRDNYGQTAAIGALAGLIYALCLTVYYSASSYATSLLSMVSLLPIAISVLVIAPILAIAVIMVPIYSNKLWATLKNAFYVYCRSALKVLGSFICCLLPWFVTMIPNFYCHVLGSAAAVLLTPFSLLAWSLLCYNRFDEHINPLVSPELIGKGIFKENDSQ